MPKYTHIFFDLDHTLWDFDKNSLETFSDLFLKYNLEKLLNCNFNTFFKAYKIINDNLWDLYRKGEIKKDYLSVQRFFLSLNEFGNNDKLLAETLSKEYVKLSPLKKNLFPYSIEVLEFLNKKYKLHIITNGFLEIQTVKIKNSGLDIYFESMITSEEAGAQKPNARIFEYSLNKTGAKVEESLMIGDDLKVDILGSKAFGMDQVYFNYHNNVHSEEVTYEIKSLLELKEILK